MRGERHGRAKPCLVRGQVTGEAHEVRLPHRTDVADPMSPEVLEEEQEDELVRADRAERVVPGLEVLEEGVEVDEGPTGRGGGHGRSLS